MQEPMKSYMKVGIVHFMAYPTIKGEGPIVETVKKVAMDEFFDVIEVTWIKDPAVRAEVKKIIENAHMTVAYGGQPRLLLQGLNANDLDEEGRMKAVATLKEGIDEAYDIGAVGFGFLSGKWQQDTKEQSFQQLVKTTKDLCAYAKSKGDMKVVLEIFDYDIDKASLIGPAKLALRYAEEVTKDYDNFGLMPDLSHLPMIRETSEQALQPIKKYIVHAHMGNCVVREKSLPNYGDNHPRFGFPGGENDVDELVDYLRVLIKVGYLNKKNPPILSFEVKPFEDEDSDLVVANAKRTLETAWAIL